MIDLTTLTGLLSPLLIAAGVLLGIAVADTQEVYIRDLTVPPSFARAGYSVEVVETRIHDNLQAFERIARTRHDTRRLAIESDKSPLELIAQYLNLTLIARAVQDASRLIEYTINVAFVDEGNQHVVRIAIRHRSGSRVNVTASRPTADIEGLLNATATGIMQVVDPHIMCSVRVRQGLAEAPPSLTAAQQCIETSLSMSSRGDRIWLYNLQGVVAYMRGDHAAALRGFRASLQIDPDFSPSMLNVGVLLAENSRHADAIRAFELVFRRESRGESPQTYAATYAEWGNSLMALGRPEQARTRYADAVRSDPRYAPAYFLWANALPPGPEADRLRAAGNQVQRANDQLYTENLVGVIRETRVAPN